MSNVSKQDVIEFIAAQLGQHHELKKEDVYSWVDNVMGFNLSVFGNMNSFEFGEKYGWQEVMTNYIRMYGDFNSKYAKPEPKHEFEEPQVKKDPWDQNHPNQLTIGDLKSLGLPDDYVIRFDGFCGTAWKEEIVINHKTKRVSING